MVYINLSKEKKIKKVLYRAEIEITNFSHRDKVIKRQKIILFRENAEDIGCSPEVYQKFVRYFDLLDEKEKKYARYVVSQFFTREEIDEMKPYFERFPETHFRPQETQLKSMEVRVKSIWPDTVPWCKKPVGENCGYMRFSHRKDYNLQVKVCGYYELDMEGEEDGR